MKKLIISALFLFCIHFVLTSNTYAQDTQPDTPADVQPVQQQQDEPQTGDAKSTITSRSFAIKNGTGTTVYKVYFSPAGMVEFGDNVMMSIPVANDETYKFTWNAYPESQCLWDVKYEYQDGTSYIVENVNLCDNNTVLLKSITR